MGDFLGFPPHHTEMNYENLFKEEHVRTFFQFRKKFNRDLENIQKKKIGRRRGFSNKAKHKKVSCRVLELHYALTYNINLRY